MPNPEAFIHLTRSYWSLLVNFSLNIVSKLKNYFILKSSFVQFLLLLEQLC